MDPWNIKIRTKKERVITEILRWGILVLITFLCIMFDIYERISPLSFFIRFALTILIGTSLGIFLGFSEIVFGDFLVRRRYRKQGYIMCKVCNGNGWTPKSSRYWFFRIHKRNHIKGTCVFCDGRGYVDWVQNVVGSKGYECDVGSSGPQSSP